MKVVFFDTGVLSIFFSDAAQERNRIKTLLEGIVQKTHEIQTLPVNIVEVTFHICQIQGIDVANTRVVSFLNLYPIQIIPIDTSIQMRAGILKCQNRKTLSYNDCMGIAYCMIHHIEFHTTETKLGEIPMQVQEKLKIVSYRWD